VTEEKQAEAAAVPKMKKIKRKTDLLYSILDEAK
jgi:hypothetical protein